MPRSVWTAIIAAMILITGGTGFIGSELVKQLYARNVAFRLLVHPGSSDFYFPKGVDLDVAVSSLTDLRGLRAAMHGVETVYHLAGVERTGVSGELESVELEGADALTQVCREAGVRQLFYLSHLGAGRASAYSLFKAKGIAEHTIRKSGVPYTIIRSSLVYGAGDYFTINLATLIRKSPWIVLIPGDGSVLFQPLWVHDLVTALIWALDMPQTKNQIYELGGPEHLSFLEILQTISKEIRLKRRFVEFNPLQFQLFSQIQQNMVRGFPGAAFWMEYLAENRICHLDSMARNFGINPARLHTKLTYLKPLPHGDKRS